MISKSFQIVILNKGNKNLNNVPKVKKKRKMNECKSALEHHTGISLLFPNNNAVSGETQLNIWISNP